MTVRGDGERPADGDIDGRTIAETAPRGLVAELEGPLGAHVWAHIVVDRDERPCDTSWNLERGRAPQIQQDTGGRVIVAPDLMGRGRPARRRRRARARAFDVPRRGVEAGTARLARDGGESRDGVRDGPVGPSAGAQASVREDDEDAAVRVDRRVDEVEEVAPVGATRTPGADPTALDGVRGRLRRSPRR